MAAALFAGLGIGLEDPEESDGTEDQGSETEEVHGVRQRKPGGAVRVQNLQDVRSEREDPIPKEPDNFKAKEDTPSMSELDNLLGISKGQASIIDVHAATDELCFEEFVAATKPVSKAEEDQGSLVVQGTKSSTRQDLETQYATSKSDEKEDEEELSRLKARPYQEELLKKAMEGNTIVYLGTGSGKTFIAVMLIKEMRGELIAGPKKAIFLVSSVALVAQQRKIVAEQTGLQVRKDAQFMSMPMYLQMMRYLVSRWVLTVGQMG